MFLNSHSKNRSSSLANSTPAALKNSHMPPNASQASRRCLLAAGLALSTGGWWSESSVKAEDGINSDASPKDVLAYLYSGNMRFAKSAALEKHRDIERIRQVAKEQKPFAAFLGCADSRVPIEIVFDQGFGDLFVTRIAGNIASSENVGSLEFGTAVLGAKVLYVLGHSNCGAVAATIKADDVPGQISGLFQHIRPAAKEGKGDLAKSIELNVRNQATVLAESSPVIAKLIRDGKLIVAGGVYDLNTGLVAPVEVNQSAS